MCFCHWNKKNNEDINTILRLTRVKDSLLPINGKIPTVFFLTGNYITVSHFKPLRF